MEYRKELSRIRCSDHHLEIERGRHMNIPRHERLCKTCGVTEIESEEHFLIHCNKFNHLRMKHHIEPTSTVQDLLKTEDPTTLGKFLIEAYELRQCLLDNIS